MHFLVVINIRVIFLVIACCCACESYASEPSAVSPTVLSLPSGPGTIQGLGEGFTTQLNTGTSQDVLNFDLPAGRNQLSPNISVVYDSGFGNGLLGIGRRLSVPYIQRQTTNGLPRYDDSETDVFINHQGAELVHIGADEYRAKIEGQFVKYQRLDQGWRISLPNGQVWLLGQNSSAQHSDRSEEKIFQWFIQSITDSNGNKINYYYDKLDKTQAVYLTQIDYNNGDSIVELEYESRPDPIVSFLPTFELTKAFRLKKIITFNDTNRVANYQFNYEITTHWQSLSRLALVSKTAGNGQDTAPPTRYRYTDFDLKNTTSHYVPSARGFPLNSPDTDFIDINADGLPDVLNTGFSPHRYWLNQGPDSNGEVQFSTMRKMKTHSRNRLSNPSVKWGDMNGDGKVNMLNVSRSASYIFKLDDSHNWQLDGDLGRPKLSIGSNNARLIDINNDRLADIFVTNNKSANGIFAHSVALNTGQGWGEPIQMPMPQKSSGVSLANPTTFMADMNGDGLTDLVHITRSTMFFFAGRGTDGFSQAIEIDNFRSIGRQIFDIRQVRFADLNHDGMADLIYLNGSRVTIWPNKGRHSQHADFSFGESLTIEHPDRFAPSAVKMADIDGNGVMDIVWYRPRKREKSFTYFTLIPDVMPNQLLSVDNGIGKVSSLEYTSVASEMLRDKNENTPWQHTLPIAMQIVKHVTTRDSSKPSQKERKTYQYRDGFYFAEERKFVGFRQATQIDPTSKSTKGGKTVYDFLLGLEDESLRGKISQIEKQDDKGRIFWRETQTWQSRRLFDSTDDDRFVSFASVKRRERELIEQGRGTPITLAWEYQHDDYGNLIYRHEFGRLDNAFNDERKTLWRYSAENSTSLVNWQLHKPIEKIIKNADDVIASKEQWFYDDESFSASNLGSVKEGNLTAHQQWIKPNSSNKTVFTKRQRYDQYGNAVAFFSPLYGEQPGHHVTIKYLNGLYPIQESLHLGGQSLVAKAEYDTALGVMTQFEDFNQQKTTLQHDGLGRVTDIIAPGDSTSAPTQSFEYHYQQSFDGVFVNWIGRLQRIEKNGRAIASRQYYDGSGRELMRVTQTEQGPRVQLHTEYDARNQLAQESLPYFSSDMGYQQTLGAELIKNEYDANNRLVKKYLPATNTQGSTFTLNVYYPMKSWVQDTAQTISGGQHGDAGKWLHYDGLNKLRQVDELVSVDASGEQAHLQTWTTQYNYDVLGNFTRLTDAFNNVRAMQYDGLSRLTYQDDPNRGQKWFNYDAASNLLGSIDSRGMAHMYNYDGLNRLLETRYYQDKQTIPKSGTERLILDSSKSIISTRYQYDRSSDNQLKNTKGQLAYVVDEAGKSWFGYDQSGRRNIERRQIEAFGQRSEVYQTQRGFNSIGKVIHLTYPDNTTLNYQYGQGGELIAMPGIVNEITYTASAKLKRVQFFNGISSDYEYDALDRLARTETERYKDRTRLQALAYEYDEMSNLLSITDERTTQERKTVAKELGASDQYQLLDQTRTYQYDDWYRLALEQNKLKLTKYRFDPIGNLIAKNVSNPIKANKDLTLRYGGSSGTNTDLRYNRQGLRSSDIAGPQALTFADVGIRYDAAGNQIQSGEQYYQWDHANRLKQVDNLQNQGKYGYDYSNKRRIKIAKNKQGDITTTLYISDDAEIRDGKMVKFTRLGKHRLAKTSQSSGPFKPELYYLKQHLGSTEMTVNSKAQVINAFNYEPFGEVEEKFGNEAQTNYRFTDKEQDKESGLGYFSQRYLSHSYGQFITPDPVFARKARFTDPQRWSPYAYGRGNPLKYVDPEGLFVTELMSLYNSYQEAHYISDVYAEHGPLAGTKHLADKYNNEAGNTAAVATVASLVPGPHEVVTAPTAVVASLASAVFGGIETGIDMFDGDSFDSVDAFNNIIGASLSKLGLASNGFAPFEKFAANLAADTLGLSMWGSSKLDNFTKEPENVQPKNQSLQSTSNPESSGNGGEKRGESSQQDDSSYDGSTCEASDYE